VLLRLVTFTQTDGTLLGEKSWKHMVDCFGVIRKVLEDSRFRTIARHEEPLLARVNELGVFAWLKMAGKS